MSTELPTNKPRDYDIPCKLLPVAEFDMSESVPPEQRASVPNGGFFRDETVHEGTEIDFSQPGRANGPPTQSPSTPYRFHGLATEPRLRRDDGSAATPLVSDELREAILDLAKICYASRVNKTPLPSDAAEALAQLAQVSSPLNGAGAFLQTVVAGQPLPPVPGNLPPPLAQVLDALAASLRRSSNGA
ncbi:MAG TPA: hypothetical protein VNX28_04250 [Gemmataceae bacterium]|jgi:hypothetical protein|nr:hypothetical protein [Gemmataceae bacterium]